MSRSRATAKAAGSSFERLTADYLNENVDDRIDRRVKTGAHDKGDIGGVRYRPSHFGGRVAIECKDYGGRLEAGKWLKEAEVERVNDGAIAGVVVAKRRGTTNPADQFVLMTLADLSALLTGVRPE